jgi:hypothetical protein
LRSAGCRHLYFKYCSTFDSTNAGNIGPVADALDDVAATSPIIERFRGVPHGRLMIDPQLLSYFTRELSDQRMMSNLGMVSAKTGKPFPNLN